MKYGGGDKRGERNDGSWWIFSLAHFLKLIFTLSLPSLSPLFLLSLFTLLFPPSSPPVPTPHPDALSCGCVFICVVCVWTDDCFIPLSVSPLLSSFRLPTFFLGSSPSALFSSSSLSPLLHPPLSFSVIFLALSFPSLPLFASPCSFLPNLPPRPCLHAPTLRHIGHVWPDNNDMVKYGSLQGLKGQIWPSGAGLGGRQRTFASVRQPIGGPAVSSVIVSSFVTIQFDFLFRQPEAYPYLLKFLSFLFL